MNNGNEVFFLQDKKYIIYKNLWMIIFLTYPSLLIILFLLILKEIVLFLTTAYSFQPDKIVIKKGFISTTENLVLKSKINNITIEQNILNKMTNSYSLIIFTGNDSPIKVSNISELNYKQAQSLNYLK